MTARIILVGLMGCGKSTVGRLLAARLNYSFVDTDEAVTAAAQMPVVEIFRQSGEAAFRRMESEALARVVKEDKRVIATGGGIVLSADNRELMRRCGVVVYLQAAVDLLAQRIDDIEYKNRPLLVDADDSVEEILAGLLRQRESLYRETAHTIVEQTATDSPPTVADKILAELKLVL